MICGRILRFVYAVKLYAAILSGEYPDLPFLAFLEFLVFFFCKEFLAFLSVFPFFPSDFRGLESKKNSLLFWWFSLPFSKKARKGRSG